MKDRMKKIIMMCFAAILAIGVFSACSDTKGTGKNSPDNSAQIKIVTTIFPEYDWTKEIIGDKAENTELIWLTDNGVDMHSYQPSVDDILTISSCDLFIYVGGESDAWVEDALKQAANKDMEVINLLDVLGEKVKNEEIVEGMEHDHDHDHDEDHDHDHEEVEFDEHVWLSIRNAIVICEEIAGRLEKIDPENADIYQKNLTAYKEKLLALDGDYKNAVAESEKKTLLFADRFPFRYLTDDYGLDYYAAFTGCSAETEAGFETVIFLSNKADELKLDIILTIENSDKKLAETIRNNTDGKDQQIMVLNSMQGLTLKDVKNGAGYLSIMTDNLNTLKAALR